MKRVLYTSTLAGALVLVGATACDNVAGVRSDVVSLTFRAPGGGGVQGVALASLQPAADVMISDNRRCVSLDRLVFTFSRIELERADVVDDDEDRDTDDENAFDDEDSDAAKDVRFRGPLQIELRFNPDGSFEPVMLKDKVPFGTFDKIEFRIDRIRAVGTFGQFVNGVCRADQPFDVDIPVREKVKIELEDPLVIDEDTQFPNVTVIMTPAQLFVINGVVIDPRRLETDHALRESFRKRIKALIRAFEDANRNGEDDRDTDHGHRHDH
jgi:hypothetical protein